MVKIKDVHLEDLGGCNFAISVSVSDTDGGITLSYLTHVVVKVVDHADHVDLEVIETSTAYSVDPNLSTLGE